jgi:hypothetical protein
VIALVLGSFDWFFASISLIASAAASHWMRSNTYVLPAPLFNSALLWIGTSVAFAVNPAPKMQLMAWLGLLVVLMINSFRFVIAAWKQSEKWPQHYWCITGNPNEPQDRSHPEDRYAHCLTSRELFYGGQNYVLLFTIKYLALSAIARYRGYHEERRCIILRQRMSIVLLQPSSVRKSTVSPPSRSRKVTNADGSLDVNQNLSRTETEYNLSSTEVAELVAALPYPTAAGRRP